MKDDIKDNKKAQTNLARAKEKHEEALKNLETYTILHEHDHEHFDSEHSE
jgi:hypothetical protein